ncbi:PAS domain-containing protein, partial [bacterium]|nr:PAS domain-containing protein [bacterium]
MAGAVANVNLAGLSKNDYRGAPSTLCQGCGHNSISNQIVSALYEMNIVPEDVVKFSGIGCSSKSPTYFLNRSFGFNSLHGRMPSVATGALFGDQHLKGIGVSGDGDSASIGMGQFKHIMRRNVNMLYIIENNGVYGLTKGQFSATAEKGLQLKKQGENPYHPIDICMEAFASNATFIARSFAGNPKQVKELLKAALAHDGIAVLDVHTTAFLDANPAYLEMTGLTHAELLRTSCLALTLEKDMQASRQAVADVRSKGFVRDFVKTCIVKGGQQVTVNMS